MRFGTKELKETTLWDIKEVIKVPDRKSEKEEDRNGEQRIRRDKEMHREKKLSLVEMKLHSHKSERLTTRESQNFIPSGR